MKLISDQILLFRNKPSLIHSFYLPLILISLLSACGGGKKSGTAPAQGNAILPSAPKLTPPTLSAPPESVHASNSTNLTITGVCTPGPGANVFLGGDEDKSVPCSSEGSFSFVVSAANDGIYNYTLHEESLIHHPSDLAPLVWERSTNLPNPPTINSDNPNISPNSSISITGTCQIGSSVNLSGDSIQTTICNESGNYTLTVTKSTDGIYIFHLSQTDKFGNISSTNSTSWNRYSTPPSAPLVTNPISSPYTGSENTIIVSGSCENNSLVSLTGSTTLYSQCFNNQFSFELTETLSQTFNYSLTASNLSGVSSNTTTFQWAHNTSVPPMPILNSPLSNSLSTNTNSISVSGSCITGNTVYLDGSTSQNTPCISNSFNFDINQSVDGTYDYSIFQKDLNNVNSGSNSLTWKRDTTPPLIPLITNPVVTNFLSSSTELMISGICEVGAYVTLSGDTSDTMPCNGNTFTFNVSKITNSTYTFTLTQVDPAGNNSASNTLNWTVDTLVPTIPTISNPVTSLSETSESSITLSGGCEVGATVYLTNSSSGSTPCTNGTYSFSISKTQDATYYFTIHQVDSAGWISPAVSHTWIRDTMAPSVILISSPLENPISANTSEIHVIGSCEPGATIHVSGANSGTENCIDGTFNYLLSETIDGTYVSSFLQTDRANNSSTTTQFQWTRLTSIPQTPTIQSPNSNIINSNTPSLTISGQCSNGNTVNLGGDSVQTILCSSNSYSFTVNKTTDSTYNFTLAQVNSVGLSSASASVAWILDQQNPVVPTITTPVNANLINNEASISITGTCEPQSSVNYNGSAQGTVSCNLNGTFSILETASTDGNFSYTLSQTDASGNSSGSTTVLWTRDTLPPATPSISQPLSNPWTSGDSNFTLVGACEPTATVQVSGSSNQSTVCDINGNYSFDITESTDGAHIYSINELDLAGNVSPQVQFQWTRDTSIPFTPILITPATNPLISNSSTLSISVSCQNSGASQAIVHLSGLLDSEVLSPAGSLTQICTSSPVTFLIQKSTDGNYTFNVYQENPNNLNSSGLLNIQWTKDSLSPANLTLSQPLISPFTGPGSLDISGSCEENADVRLTGDALQNTTCTNGSYAFIIIKSTDATYNFALQQFDAAGNASGTSTIQWIRNSDSLPSPTINNPMINPVSSNLSSLTLSGTCTSPYIVTLSGNILASEITSPSNTLEQTCSPSGTYSFTLNKSTDGTFTFNLTQSFNSAISSANTQIWKRDTQSPIVTITPGILNPNLSSNASFTFSANESSTFQCKIGSATYQSCTSPMSYSGLANQSTTFSVIATDSVGNIGTAASYTWTQAAYKSVALYHFPMGTATALTDSSLFTSQSIFNNNLTAFASPALNSTGKLPSATPKSATLGTGKYFEVANNNSINSVSSTMTVEGLFNFSSMTGTTGQYYTLFSSTGAASPNLGWEVRLEKQNTASCTRWYLKFVGSLDGLTQTTVPSSCIRINTNTWYYVAVTWNNGNIAFNMSTSRSTTRGTGTIGTPGSAKLATPAAATLKVGANSSSGTGSSLWITGSVDEVRISNIVRTPNFPATEYTPD